MDDVRSRRAMLWGAVLELRRQDYSRKPPRAQRLSGRDDPYDLVVRGGEVVDPSQGLRGRRDVAIRNARWWRWSRRSRRRAARR